MIKYLPLPLLFFGFWMLGYIAGPRQSPLTKDRVTTMVSSAVAAALVTGGLWLLRSRDGNGR